MRFLLTPERVVFDRPLYTDDEWSGPTCWQVRGGLPECVGPVDLRQSEELTKFTFRAIQALEGAQPITFGEPYEVDDEIAWRRVAEGRELVVDAVLVYMLEQHCGEGEWVVTRELLAGQTVNCPSPAFAYLVDGEPQALLAPRRAETHDLVGGGARVTLPFDRDQAHARLGHEPREVDVLREEAADRLADMTPAVLERASSSSSNPRARAPRRSEEEK